MAARPDINAKKLDLEKYLENEVFPYLESLLNRAQRKLRHKLCYIDLGNFMVSRTWIRRSDGSLIEHLDFDDEIKTPGSHLAYHFSELVEFNELVKEVESKLHFTMGGMSPTVRPRQKRRNKQSH